MRHPLESGRTLLCTRADLARVVSLTWRWPDETSDELDAGRWLTLARFLPVWRCAEVRVRCGASSGTVLREDHADGSAGASGERGCEPSEASGRGERRTVVADSPWTGPDGKSVRWTRCCLLASSSCSQTASGQPFECSHSGRGGLFGSESMVPTYQKLSYASLHKVVACRPEPSSQPSNGSSIVRSCCTHSPPLLARRRPSLNGSAHPKPRIDTSARNLPAQTPSTVAQARRLSFRFEAGAGYANRQALFQQEPCRHSHRK